MLFARVRRIGLVVSLALLLEATPALAHESVTVGDYEFEVGWVSEPVLVGQLNGLELFVAPVGEGEPEGGHTEGEHIEGVAGLEDTLVFTVVYGGVEREYALTPVLDRTGAYTAAFIPTRAGQYTFRFTGSVCEQPVDVEVEAEEVEDVGALAFPEAEVTSAELAQRIATAQSIAVIGALLGAAGVAWGLFGRRRS